MQSPLSFVPCRPEMPRCCLWHDIKIQMLSLLISIIMFLPLLWNPAQRVTVWTMEKIRWPHNHSKGNGKALHTFHYFELAKLCLLCFGKHNQPGTEIHISHQVIWKGMLPVVFTQYWHKSVLSGLTGRLIEHENRLTGQAGWKIEAWVCVSSIAVPQIVRAYI